MLIFGYFILVVIVVMFFISPRNALLLSFFCKPTIDIFWSVKNEGYISPLFIAGVVVPLLAILSIPKINKSVRIPIFSKIDRIIGLYLIILLILTILKVVNTPQYTYNSIDTFSRLITTTSFYYIGKYYFNEPSKLRQLALAIVFSAIIPFFLTILQIGEILPKAEPMQMREGDQSAFYLGGRHDIQRISGVYEGVYELAFMGLFVVLILYILKLSNVRFPIRWYGIMIPGFYFLYFTYSRSAWMLFITSLLLFFIFKRRIGSVVITLMCTLTIYLLVPTVQFRFEDELGFLIGEKQLGAVGYGRGNVWSIVMEKFLQRDFLSKIIGTYGITNPENQFLGFLVWFGAIGLITFLFLIIFLTISMIKKVKYLPIVNSVEVNLILLFISVNMCSYWFAGLGNFFIGQISTQWIIWIWTGIIMNISIHDKTLSSISRCNYYQSKLATR